MKTLLTREQRASLVRSRASNETSDTSFVSVVVIWRWAEHDELIPCRSIPLSFAAPPSRKPAAGAESRSPTVWCDGVSYGYRASSRYSYLRIYPQPFPNTGRGKGAARHHHGRTLCVGPGRGAELALLTERAVESACQWLRPAPTGSDRLRHLLLQEAQEQLVEEGGIVHVRHMPGLWHDDILAVRLAPRPCRSGPADIPGLVVRAVGQ